MCRIAGSFGYSPSAVGMAILHQQKGGPDNQNWEQLPNGVVFGHARLSIIDLSSNGNQPMHTERYSIVYNGEIYNYKDLGYGNNDTRVLLNYIHENGIEEALRACNGMFAFGVYDKVYQKIYIAVDRFGQKPLYYFHQGDKFFFSSAPAAMYHLKDKWQLDREALQSYWLLGSVMGEDSIFKGIKKLTGSHYAVFDCRDHTLEVKKYWEPEFKENTEDIQELVLDAINKVKVSDVPIHIFLSGGIDSTLVASQFEGGHAVHLESPEEKYAEEVARKFRIHLNKVEVGQIETENYLTDYSLQCGEPSMAAIIPYTTAKEVSKLGKVAITANGADELFFGYDRTSEHATKKQNAHIFRFSLFHSDLIWEEETKSNGRLLELNSYVQFDLNKTLDFASMCHGLEVRAPFLDHRLVECALSIPESKHRAKGNKTILKEILSSMGFDKHFLNRPKLGFSLHRQPENMENLIEIAWKWVQDEGYLLLNGAKLSGRDDRYLKMSALGFYYWFQVWKHKID